MKAKKQIIALAVSLLMLAGCYKQTATETVKTDRQSNYKSSLTTVSQSSFQASLDSVLGKSEEKLPTSKDDRVNLLVTALDRAGFLNIADIYSQDEITKGSKDLNLQQEHQDFAKYILAAKDIFQLAIKDVQAFLSKKDDKQDLALVQKLEEQVLAYQNKLKNYIGYTTDNDIYEKLNQAYNEFTFFKGNPLEKLGMQAILDGTITGYNVKYHGYDANFAPNLTLVYSHDKIKHAQQLVKLLAKEKIKAKVQLQPKTSSFEYMIDWGAVPEPTDKYEVVKISDKRYLANALEYDLLFEFANTEDMDKFDGLIEKYAKKNEGNEEGKGLLYASWWQPLYHTTREMGKGYSQVTENILTKGNFEMYTITKNEDAKKLVESMQSKDKDLKIESNKISVSDAFFRYLNGDFK